MQAHAGNGREQHIEAQVVERAAVKAATSGGCGGRGGRTCGNAGRDSHERVARPDHPVAVPVEPAAMARTAPGQVLSIC